MHESNIDKVIPASKMQGEDKQKLFQRVHEHSRRKQGCPLSPTLTNLCSDQLKEFIQETLREHKENQIQGNSQFVFYLSSQCCTFGICNTESLISYSNKVMELIISTSSVGIKSSISYSIMLLMSKKLQVHIESKDNV